MSGSAGKVIEATLTRTGEVWHAHRLEGKVFIQSVQTGLRRKRNARGGELKRC